MREKLANSHWAIRLVTVPVIICFGLWSAVHFGVKPLLPHIIRAINL
jgi:hypothetical protein